VSRMISVSVIVAARRLACELPGLARGLDDLRIRALLHLAEEVAETVSLMPRTRARALGRTEQRDDRVCNSSSFASLARVRLA